jgi:hypothetical protein
MAVPDKQYKEWYYPSKPIVADMDRIDLSNFAIITYVFSKSTVIKRCQTFSPRRLMTSNWGTCFISSYRSGTINTLRPI